MSLSKTTFALDDSLRSIRALLDEIESSPETSETNERSARLVEDLARLGCRFLEEASALSSVVEPETRKSERAVA